MPAPVPTRAAAGSPSTRIMPAARVIARLDVKGPNLVKGIHLEGLRVIGDPWSSTRWAGWSVRPATPVSAIMLLQPTSPFRRAARLRQGLGRPPPPGPAGGV